MTTRPASGCVWSRARSGRAGATVLAGLLLLGACSTATPPSQSAGAVAAGLCRLGPDDGPPLADRGIGGTGAPTAVADRGIGGTGQPARTADRGIGGTGIVAVITGFASICLAGVEVALDPGVPVTLNGQAIPPGALRAGQLAVVDAEGSGTALSARSVAVREEVSGPVEAVSTSGWLRVAGQRVRVSSATLGEQRPAIGQWVAVSGLRGPDGAIQATRIDRRAPGEVLVRGQTALVDGSLRIGGLRLQTEQPQEAGRFVTASGLYRGGILSAAQLAPDRLASDPAAAFPATTGRILVEGYAVAGQDGLRLGPGPLLPSAAGFGATAPMRAVVEFRREPGGGLRATGMRQEGPAPAMGPAMGPARQAGGPMGGPGMGAGMGAGMGGRASQPAPVPGSMPQGGGAQAGGAQGGGNAGPQRGGSAQSWRRSGAEGTGGAPSMPGGPGAGAAGPSAPPR